MRALALTCLLALGGCTGLRAEYEHISHPMAGPPFGPRSEEDSLNQVNLCAVRATAGLRYSVFGETCLGVKLADGGFYGPELTSTVRIGVEFQLSGR
jgi:hypothetical protein